MIQTNFVMMNPNIVLEIAQLDELGYKIAQNQMDMTPKQKLFLPRAYNYLEQVREEKGQNNNSKPTASINRLKQRIRQKQQSKGV